MRSLINLAFDENGQKAAKIDLSKFKLRVLPTIFDPTLKTHFFLTDGARPNSFFLLKQLTQKLYADSISADSTPTSGSGEQLKIKTSNAIGFRYRRAEGS